MIEGTAAQTSLQPKSREHDTVDLNDIVKRALAHMQDLNRDQKVRFISLVNQIHNSSYQDNGSMSAQLHEPFSGDAIPSTTHDKNIKKLHGEDWKTVAQLLADEQHEVERELDTTLSEVGFTEDVREKCATLFHKAVDAKSNIIRQVLNSFVAEYKLNPFTITDEELDCVQLLSDRIGLLELALNDAAMIKEELIEEIQEMQERSSLQEETNDGWFSTPKPERRIKRSTIEEQMLSPDESNADALYNTENQVGDFRMQQYLRAMGHD